MNKRPNVRPPPEPKEKMAADRLGALDQWGKAREANVYNNFALTALVLAGLIILIGLAYVTGMVK